MFSEKQYLYNSASEAVTERIGALLGKCISEYGKPCFIALDGDMGAGKTAFVRGLASVLSPCSRVKSPTYTIVNEYRKGKLPLFHFDLYRIADAEDELYGIGFDDYIADGVCVAEWSSVLDGDLPDNTIHIDIRKTGESEREISVLLPSVYPAAEFEEGTVE